MSHASGWVTRDGAAAGHFLYDGYEARRRIHPSLEAAWATCRDGAPEPECGSGGAHPRTPVTLRTDYGWGVEWSSEACFTCGVITGPVDPRGWILEEEKGGRWGWLERLAQENAGGSEGA